MTLPMTFLWPQFLWLLLAVPLLVLVYAWLLRRKKKLVLRYASVAIVKQAMGAGMGWRRLVAAQDAAKAFLKDLPKNIKVAILTFAGTAL